MYFIKIKAIALLCLASMMIFSCSEDLVDTTTENRSTTEVELSARPGNNNSPPERADNQANQGQNGSQNNGQNGRGQEQGGRDQNGRDAMLVSQLGNNITSLWFDKFLEIERYADGMRPNASARALAYINLAAYETAVPGMPSFSSNEGRIPSFDLNGNTNGDIDWEVAPNTCYANVMRHFLINVPDNHMNKIDELESTISTQLSDMLSNQVIRRSEQWGESIARQVIAYSLTDRDAERQIQSPQPSSYEPPNGDGFWTYSADEERALFPYWESVRTFVVSTDETTTQSPIPYNESPNSQYFDEMQEVYEINNSARADDGEQLWIAEFWSDDVTGITFGPPSRQFSIANQLIAQYDLNLEETLHLYLKLGFSMNDAAVSTWKYKYEHMVMRPNVFIHEFIDPGFQTNLFRLVYWPNPSFPGYPSGHSCFASAGAGVFIDIFGDNTNFTDRSHEGRTEFRGEPRSYGTFSEMAVENAFSRIPLGVHIRMDCAEGIRLGYEISDGINDYNLMTL